MACENPKRIKNRRYVKLGDEGTRLYSLQHFHVPSPPDLYVDVPCGHCFSCQKSRMNQYRMRLMMELQKYEHSLFVTLTFDDESLERFKNEPNKSLRLFFDRLRKKYKRSYRHWFVAEYGTENGRLHYHGLIFDTPKYGFPFEEFSALWSYGHVFLGWCAPDTISYIVKYTTKYANGSNRPPRVFCSKGIGDNYLTRSQVSKHKGVLPKTSFMSVNGRKYPLPRYWFNKIFDDDDKMYLMLKSQSEPFSRFVDGKEYTDEREYREALAALFRKNVALKLSYPKDPYKKDPVPFDVVRDPVSDPDHWLDYDPTTFDEFSKDVYPF